MSLNVVEITAVQTINKVGMEFAFYNDVKNQLLRELFYVRKEALNRNYVEVRFEPRSVQGGSRKHIGGRYLWKH